MKHLLALLFGLAIGAAIALAFIYYNPFLSGPGLSPLNVSGGQQIALQYSAVADDAIAYTNNGETRVQPVPASILQLWEGPIRQSEAMMTLLRDSRGSAVGLGVKFASRSEGTRLLNGEALVDSVWHIYMPGRGTLMVAQTENHWAYLRDIVIPAYLSAGDSWRGNWVGTVSHGPGALGTARVVGGSGEFSGAELEAIETLNARAWSSSTGPARVEGQLLIERHGAAPESDDLQLNSD